MRSGRSGRAQLSLITILAAGSRHMPSWAAPWILAEFQSLQLTYPFEKFRLVQGGADGADQLAGLVGQYLGWEVITEMADWKNLGRAAGPERNQRQLAKWKPTRAFFFHHSPLLGTGTHDMYTRCIRAGVVSKIVLYPSIMIVKVLNLDGVPDSEGETFDPAGVELPPFDVPIQFRFWDTPEDLMGWATLEKRPDGVYAQLKLNPERVEEAKKLWPSIGGRVTKREGTLIKHCEVRVIGLYDRPNQDRRIEKVGDQKVEA